MDDLHSRRHEYDRDRLREDTIAADPFRQFDLWLAEALALPGIVEPHAMTLGTADPQGRPSARIVLLRAWDSHGFVFYTNYGGRKGRELEQNPAAALLFWWGELQRQIRIEGAAERVSVAESDAYFASRPRGAQLSAWASPQSSIIVPLALAAAMDAAAARFPEAVPRPPQWGGFRVVPARFEFWQGRPNRMHDRIVFVRDADGWTTTRLAP